MEPGTRLGPYEVLSRLGAGGMGEVYRARDTRLDRHVAIKVLPPSVAQREDLRTRFEREARAISALNHPHICTLFDVGIEGTISYLVMELLEGETLASAIARGALPLERALRIGIEIAAALDRAHRQGIVHRDLKPGNIMITKSGVKLLDFGLARMSRPLLGHDAPTIVGAPMTSEGMIVGTLEYMAPEQLEGGDVDGRADIFAFGCILYEMISGRRAFSGSSPASLITAIMSSEPPPIATATVTPPALERLIRKCLAKNRDERWQSAGDLGTALQWLLEEPAVATTAGNRKRSFVPWAGTAVVVAAALTATFIAIRGRTPPPMLRLTMPLDGVLSEAYQHPIALSPDGRTIVYSVTREGSSSLFVRTLADGSVTAIPNTANASFPFWSPDSTRIAFVANGKLMRIAPNGQEAAKICDVDPGALAFTADWGADGTIVYSDFQAGAALFRVPSAGGEPRKIDLKLPDSHVLWPRLLDGERVAYLASRGGGADELLLHIRNLGSGHDQNLGPIAGRFELLGDTMFFVRDGSLFAQRVDRDLGRQGQPVLLATSVWNFAPLGGAAFSVSPDAIAYVSSALDSHMTWIDGTGNRAAVGPRGVLWPPHISRDGRKAVVGVPDPQLGTDDVWICDLARNSSTQITTARGTESSPVWSPDGRTIAYSSDVGGPPHVFTMSAAGGVGTEITPVGPIQFVQDWSPDGKWIAVRELAPDTRGDIVLVEPRPRGRVVRWLATPFDEDGPRFSPDSQWIAYASNASGKQEIYVARVADPTERYQISSGGGLAAAWRADGREIAYMTDDRKIYSVAVKSVAPFDTAPPQLRAQSSGGRWDGFDVSADGQRFLVSQILSGPTTQPLNVIVNWRRLLERR